MDQNEPRKRQKSEKSEKPRPEDLAYDGRVLSEVPQTSKQRSAQRSSKGKTTEEQVQRYRPVPVKAEDRSDITDSPSITGIEARSESSKNKEVQSSSQASAKAQHFHSHDAQLDKPREQASRNRGRKKRPKQDCRESLKKREVSVPQSFRPCTCEELPDYFTRDPSYVPNLKTWPLGKLEFLEHVRQISACRGSIHPPHVVSACRKILEENRYPEHFPSTSGRNDSNPKRAQSSIPPPVFYGKRSGCQPDPSTGSAVHQPQQNGNTVCSPFKTLPVRNRGEAVRPHDIPLISQPSKAAEFNKPCNYLTPPNSSSLGQRRRAGMPSHPHEGSNSLSEQENVGAKRISTTLPGASSVLDRQQRSFDAQRRRHQSAPVNVLSRNTAVDDRDRLLPSAQQRHNNVLQEISNNAIFQRMVQRMDEFQKAILERLPATTPTQIAAAGPVLAPAASITAPAQGVNRVGQPPAGRNSRGLSHAERLPRFPKYDRNVPEHLRHTDEEIIEIGRIVNCYERHKRAPEAFGWGRGRLYCQYNELLSRTVDGVLVWTPDEIRRLTR